jgi:hypothetical protein
MHEAQRSTDYRRPYIRSLDEYIEPPRWARYHTPMQTFDGSTDSDWAAIKHILAGIDALYHEWSMDSPERQSSTFGRVARVEFINKQDEVTGVERRGAVLFDNYRRPLLHTTNALLGYGGSGPGFSQQILQMLGVPERMFDEANRSVTHGDYDNVVFSREAIGVGIAESAVIGGKYYRDPYNTGDIITQPGMPVADSWTWWLA